MNTRQLAVSAYVWSLWLRNPRLAERHGLKTIEGEPIHYGGYTSFLYELDEADLRAENRLTVRIADSMDAEIPRRNQESHVYKRGGIWYQTYTGAVRSVWLESVGRTGCVRGWVWSALLRITWYASISPPVSTTPANVPSGCGYVAPTTRPCSWPGRIFRFG